MSLTRFLSQKRKKRYKTEDNIIEDGPDKIDVEDDDDDLNRSYFYRFLCGSCSTNKNQKSKIIFKQNETLNKQIQIIEIKDDENDNTKDSSSFIDKNLIIEPEIEKDFPALNSMKNSIKHNNKKRKTIYLNLATATTTTDEENTSEIDKKNNKRDFKHSSGIKIFQHRGSHQNTQIDGFPKFLTANNILTDRGCIVNIRTGSFNLGCTANSDAVETNKDDDEIKVDNSVKKSSIIIPKLSVCQVSDNDEHFVNDDEEYDDENCDNFDLSEFNDYCTQRVSLVTKSGHNNLLLNTHVDQQDQFRRCSHDPNIEKLHKNYIDNVKLLDVPTPASTSIATLTALTSSLSICKQSSSDSSFYNENNKIIQESLSKNSNNSKINECEENTQNFLTAARRESLKLNSKSAELLSSDNNEKFNEILRVNEWLTDNQNHHLRHVNKTTASASMSNMEESNNECEKEKAQKKKKLYKKIIKVNEIGEYEEKEEEEEEGEVVEEDSKTDKKKSDITKKKNNLFVVNKNENNDSNQTETPDVETNDSAVDIESYDTMSSVSKESSKSRTNWQSFSKNYHLHFFHSTTWSKYQISAMSLDQIMALRKLSLLQFSKLVERQHSTVIRTFRLFSKKRDVEEFFNCEGNSKSSENNECSSSINYSVNYPKKASKKQKKEENELIPNNSCSIAMPLYWGIATSIAVSNANNSSNVPTYNLITSSILSSVRLCDLRVSSVVFGLPLHIIMQRTGQPLPQKIIESMKLLRKLGPRAIGIFRKNGVKTRINRLKDAIDKNEDINFNLFYTLYDIADMIKLYFRQLPECLMTNKLSDILLTNYDSNEVSVEERKLILQQVMLLIPDESRLALQTLLLFLNDIAKHCKTNQMTRSNLAVCFSPVLFHLNIDIRKRKLYGRNRTRQQQSILNNTLQTSEDNEIVSINENVEIAQTSADVAVSSLNENQNKALPQQTLESYKRKCSQTFNKAATSIANFSAGIVDSNNYTSQSTSINIDEIEYISKVGQICVSDMIKYSMDLFTVPVENFEKLKLSLLAGSEPPDLDYYYDSREKILKQEEFFKSNINMQNLNWSYYDKYEDISIYYYKNEQILQMNQRDQQFYEKLKLWKCCTLIKQQNLTLEKIMNRISNERILWDDDFKEGKVIEKLDKNTELYKYVISLMPPHPSRDFTEIRHWSKLNDNTIIYTTTSIKSNDKLIGDIRSNMIISKYIIEKLIDNELVNTYKISHLTKLDYKGFTIEFYNRSLGYTMARLLHRLKISFNN